MAWRRAVQRGRIEAPEWYRVYHSEDWHEPDWHELAMIKGCTGNGRPPAWPDDPESAWPQWPQWLHEEHSQRRWAEAQHAYRQADPELAEQEFNDIVSGHAERHRAV